MGINELKIMEICNHATRYNRVKVAYIAKLTGLSERAVRNSIKDLRNQGHFICALPESPGYWMAKNEQDKKDFIRFLKSYPNDIYNTIRILENSVEGQTCMAN